jgi:hypothetical protein
MKQRTFSIFLTTILSALLVSCGSVNATPDYQATFQPEITKTETGNTLIVTANFTAVILTADFMEKHDPFIHPPAYWTPEVDQVLYIESNIESYLSEHPSLFHSGRAPDREKLSTYGRQYYGVVVEDGTRYIYGLFFCPYFQKHYDWQNEYVAIVSGGGDCLIVTFYYPDSGEFGAIAGSLK